MVREGRVHDKREKKRGVSRVRRRRGVQMRERERERGGHDERGKGA
jgi:hypothetical protein